MRKDVECFFGILKGRFRILRYGFRFQSIGMCDNLFLTCLALHNFLLHKDGLDKGWEDGNDSYWNRDYNANSIQGEILRTPFAVQRLNRQIHMENQQHFNKRRNDQRSIGEQCKKYTVNGKRIVAKMSLSLFQNCLVNNFDIRFKNKTIVWPSRFEKKLT